MTWMRNAALGLVLLALLGAAPLFPTEQSQRLADAFSERVRALEVTFNVPGLGLRNHVRTAVALAADEAGTWWLTAPAALSLPGHVDATLAKVQLSDSEASVTVRAVVDDFSGTYALLLESQDRGFAPLAVRPLLPMHGLQWAGLLYAAEDGPVRVLPRLQEIEEVHQRPNGPAKAFTFRTFERLPRSAVGAPVFVNAFGDFADGSDPGFALAGFVVEPRLPAPSLQLRVKGVQAPAMGQLFPEGVEREPTSTDSNQAESTDVSMPQIVINEVESNPSGNDNRREIEEWVELYNPTNDSLSLSGWSLIATQGQNRIDLNGIIAGKDYFVFQQGSQWINNEDSVMLVNPAGEEVDQSPLLVDENNNSFSWQRCPNGQDTDSVNDWRFQASSKDMGNAC